MKYLTSITELSKDIIQKMNLFDSQKGENWTEYHLYEIKIQSLEKENEKKKKEKNDLEKQKEDLNRNISMIDNEIENLNFYKSSIEKDSSLLLPVTSEKIGNEIYQGNYQTNVCQICKYNCHINCDKMIKSFCECFKFSLKGFKCQVCPNKCFSSSHEIVPYQYPKYIYKKIDEILKAYCKSEFPKNMSYNQRIEYAIELKKEEKIKQNNDFDILINENNSIINNLLKDIDSLEDKRYEISRDNENKINEEIRKFNNGLNKINLDNLKDCHKLIIEYLKEFFIIKEYGKSSSSGGRCC